MQPTELTLDDMLAEPIVKLLMTRDGVHEAELRLLMHGAQIFVTAAPKPDTSWSASAAR